MFSIFEIAINKEEGKADDSKKESIQIRVVDWMLSIKQSTSQE